MILYIFTIVSNDSLPDKSSLELPIGVSNSESAIQRNPLIHSKKQVRHRYKLPIRTHVTHQCVYTNLTHIVPRK